MMNKKYNNLLIGTLNYIADETKKLFKDVHRNEELTESDNDL